MRGQIPPESGYLAAPTTIGEHIWKRRLDLELHQKDVARQVGVSTSTVTTWELGHREPGVRHLPKIIDFLGYDPEPEPTSFGERVASHRRRRGLSRVRLASILGVDEGSVRRVEEGRPVGQVLSKVFEAFLAHCDAGRDLETLSLPERRRRDEAPETLETVGDHIRKRRLELGLNHQEAARQLGCSKGTLLNWELRRRSVSIRKMPAVLAFLDYDPHPKPSSLSEVLRAVRRERGITAAELAVEIGVAESTVTGWETGSTEPTGRGAPKLWRFLERECPGRSARRQ